MKKFHGSDGHFCQLLYIICFLGKLGDTLNSVLILTLKGPSLLNSAYFQLSRTKKTLRRVSETKYKQVRQQDACRQTRGGGAVKHLHPILGQRRMPLNLYPVYSKLLKLTAASNAEKTHNS